MEDFWAAMGLVLIFEGMLYGGFPDFARKLAAQIQLLSDNQLRTAGAIAVAGGFALVWLVRA